MMRLSKIVADSATTAGAIHPAARLGAVSLTVADLDRQVAFQTDVLGFKLHWREGKAAGLGAGEEDLVRFVELAGAQRAAVATGLYHYAVRFHNRRALAHAVARLFANQYTNYPTDHVMTKSTYLKDPEGQEIELYGESPADGTMEFVHGSLVVRHSDGTASDGREPLDLDALFGVIEGDSGPVPQIPAPTRIGHVHLYVRDLSEAMTFYTRIIGFDDMGTDLRSRMGVVSAGGYHHHVGLNTWMGQGAPPAPPDSVGMRYFTVLLPNKPELDRVLSRIRKAGIALEDREEGHLVRDPSQNAVMLKVDTGS
jgi:catechol 2,3-dioxygenase